MAIIFHAFGIETLHASRALYSDRYVGLMHRLMEFKDTEMFYEQKRYVCMYALACVDARAARGARGGSV